MLKKVKTMMAVAVLSGTVSANVHAATIHVKKGDTLWGLSHVHKTTVEKLKEWNHLHSDLIRPGEVLTISPVNHYIVRQGDTLWGISRAHNISVSQLMKQNNLTSDLIHPGLNLVIPDGSTTINHSIIEKQRNLSVHDGHSYEKVDAAPRYAVRASTESGPRVEAASTTIPSSGRAITVTATAYTASCAGCSGTTATGINIKANPNAKVIAVDPSVIPLGSKVYIEGYGEYTAADTGGAIKGNRIDIFISSEQAALNFGRKQLKVTILN